jgi:uncharacterized MAPEG superfamily protein
MTPELTYLVWAVALCFLQMLIAVCGAAGQVGLPTLASNRVDMQALTGWADRAQRAHRNMLENLVLFAALVLVAVAAGRINPTTTLGAQIFLFGRVAYAIVFVAGIPWVRTVMWTISVVGLLMIFSQVV